MAEVKVFTTTGCANCEQVKEYLKEADIEFIERNIAENEEAAEELKKLGALSVPCVVAGDMIIRGFDRAKLDELIACLTAPAGA
ncbi:MAG: glutaredoxin family protein [Candidatus Brocadiales bacterium]